MFLKNTFDSFDMILNKTCYLLDISEFLSLFLSPFVGFFSENKLYLLCIRFRIFMKVNKILWKSSFLLVL